MQAMSRSSPTAPSRMNSAGRKNPTISRCSSTTRAPHPSLVLRCSRLSRAVSASSSRWASRSRAPRREPSHRFHEVRGAAVLREIPHQPLPDIRVARKVKPWRHHAGHLIVVVVHAKELADDRAIALEPRPPEPMADEHEPIARIEGPVAGNPAPSTGRTPITDWKFPLTSMVVTRTGSCCSSRSVTSGRHQAAASLNTWRQRAIVHEVDGRDRLVFEALLVVRFPEHHEPVGFLVRQRPQDDAVDDAEDRGGRPDPERERDDRRNREARGPQQVAGPKRRSLRKCSIRRLDGFIPPTVDIVT